MIRYFSAHALMAVGIIAVIGLPAEAQRGGGGRPGSDRNGGDRNNRDEGSDSNGRQRQKDSGGGGGRDFWGGGSASGGSGSSARTAFNAASAAKTRAPASAALPDQYKSLDRDRDGQIGLYEWAKTDYAGFAKLDLNSDGFLTPQELARATGRTVTASRSSSSSTESTSSDSTSTTESSETPADGAATPVEADNSTPATSLFSTMDKDKDGRLSEKEWKDSFLAPPKFAAKGIRFTFPIQKAEFLAQYPKAFTD